MCVDASVSGCPCEVLVFPVGDVLVCASVPVLLGQTKVYNVYQVALLAQPHQKVVRFHISVNEVLGVDEFDSADL